MSERIIDRLEAFQIQEKQRERSVAPKTHHRLMQDGSMVEVGTIGREGTTAIPLIMGANTTANESFCQVHGRAWKIPAQSFIALLEGSPDFRTAMNRYLQAYVNMLGQIAACNGLHSVLERCARWLLMTQDRVNRSDFPMTHEFLAAMLGSSRSGVTVAAATLRPYKAPDTFATHMDT